MKDRVLGIDVSTRALAFAVFEDAALKKAWWVGLPLDAVNRLAVANDYASVLPSGLVIVPEDPPMVRNSSVHRALCEVLGAFLAGCTTAAWVHPGLPVSSWKKATVGNGNASKGQVRAWVESTYARVGDTQDVCDAIGIAHAGAAWWATRREAA